MRLTAANQATQLRGRVIESALRLRLGQVPDVLRVCLHRPEFFGRGFLAWVEEALRGPSRFSQGERELMAAVVSKANSCDFCVGSHSATAAALLGPEALQATLNDDSPGDGQAPELWATLQFVKKLTLAPTKIGIADVEAAISAGASAEDLRDAVEVCAAFNVINRVADALDFAPQNKRALKGWAKLLTTRGYRA